MKFILFECFSRSSNPYTQLPQPIWCTMNVFWGIVYIKYMWNQINLHFLQQLDYTNVLCSESLQGKGNVC
jgi:hypothetical protein